MAYLVLARKYRPQTFGDMAGQEHVVRTISNALRSGQLAHAFLFTGPRGVGKTTAARLVAKALDCEKGPTAEPCGVCTPCVEIAEGRSVDVVEIDAASNNGVDNVRDIVEAVKYRPARDRYKVFVVDEVHMLSAGAFNALLKTLEEPPEHVKFVLATTDVHKVPETILSRCQRFDFRRLTLQQIADQLAKVAKAEGMSVSSSAFGLIARAAEGGMRDALSMLDQVRASCGDAPGDDAVAEALGAVDAAAVSRICAALIRRDGAAALAEVAALDARGLETKRVAEEIVRHLRNVVVARLAPGAPLDLPDAELAEVRVQAQGAPPAQLTRLFDVAQRAAVEVKLSEQPRYALEVALLRGVFLAPGAEVADLIGRLEALAGGAPPPGGGGGSAPRPARSTSTTTSAHPEPFDSARPERSARPASAESKDSGQAEPRGSPLRGGEGERQAGWGEGATPDDPSAPLAERWRAAVEEIEKVSPFAAPALKQAGLLWIRDGEVGIQLPPGTFADMVERRRAEVEAALARFFGRSTKLAVTLGAPAPPAPGADAGPPSLAAADVAERLARSRNVREVARSHPNIREAARILDGRVEDVEEL